MTEVDRKELRRQIDTLASEMNEWEKENFGGEEENRRVLDEIDYPTLGPMICALGIQEEAGELAHSVIKRFQGIREDEEGVGVEAEKDAIGDIMIYCTSFCNRRGYDVGECLELAWYDEVSDREWDSRFNHE